MFDESFFQDWLPRAFKSIEITFDSENLSVEKLRNFKAEMDELWSFRVDHFSSLRDAYFKLLSELETMENAKNPQRQKIEEKAKQVETAREFYKNFEPHMLNARRAEELARVLPEIYEGNPELTRWFVRNLQILCSYTPVFRNLTIPFDSKEELTRYIEVTRIIQE